MAFHIPKDTNVKGPASTKANNSEVSIATTTTDIANKQQVNTKLSNARPFLSWFHPNDGPLERRVILKLDIFLLSFSFAGFWVMYIDRGVLINAYVSGMREDLKLYGNELVQLNSLYWVGYSVSMIPGVLFLTKYRPHIIMPLSMSFWALFTLLTSQAKGFPELAGYRFLVGLFTGPFFAQVHYCLGSWYRPDEIVRRAGIFYLATSVGNLTTGLLAARIYQDLNGVHGCAGWRWMYIIAAIITIPIAIWGFITFPGIPSAGKRWHFKQDEFELAKERMEACGRKEPVGIPLNRTSLRRFLGRWHFWVLIPWNILWVMSFSFMGQGTHALWLRSLGIYSVVQVNNFTAISPSVGIIWILSFAWIADRYGNKGRLGVICGVSFAAIFIHLPFVLFDKSPFGWKWFAVAAANCQAALSPLIFSWANIICSKDAEERAFIMGALNAIATAFSAWVPLLVWRTVEAPRFFKGYLLQLCILPVYAGLTVLVYYLDRKEVKESEKEKEEGGIGEPTQA